MPPDEQLQMLAASLARARGEDFFPVLAEHLGATLGAREALICEAAPARRARTLAVWRPGGAAQNYDYDLAGTPCARVYAGEQLSIDIDPAVFPGAPQRWGAYFGMPLAAKDGAVLGHLCAWFDHAITLSAEQRAVCEVLADRAAAELRLVHVKRERALAARPARSVARGNRPDARPAGPGRQQCRAPPAARRNPPPRRQFGCRAGDGRTRHRQEPRGARHSCRRRARRRNRSPVSIAPSCRSSPRIDSLPQTLRILDRRHPAARRGGRAGAGDAGQTARGVAGIRRGTARGGHARCAHHRHHGSRSARGGAQRRLPRRPAARARPLRDRTTATAHARRGHSRAVAAPGAETGATPGPACGWRGSGFGRRADALLLARQRARARRPGRARDADPVRSHPEDFRGIHGGLTRRARRAHRRRGGRSRPCRRASPTPA